MRVLIGEDDVLIAEHLKTIIMSYNYEVVALAHNKDNIISNIESTMPDIALLDIRMKGKYDGIEIAEFVRQNYNFPIIFITAHSDNEILNRALETNPAGYIKKPFEPIEIKIAIDIAVKNYVPLQFENALCVKDGYKSVNIPYYKILFLKADGVYTEIHTDKKVYVQRIGLQKLLESINASFFIQIHRSYVVNVNNIDEFFTNKLTIKNNNIPISRKYKCEVLSLFK